jgi:methionyl-tRNA formyltransferase
MRYIFFGSPKFAQIILEKLITAGYIPTAIVCNPDKPFGRKKIITPPPVKILAEKYNIKVYQPEKLEIENFKLEIGEIDFAIVAAYAKIIKKEILDIPKFGTIGTHPSLLPKYRGSSPIQSQILSGDKIAGTTLYLMDAGMDSGPILAQKKLEVKNMNYENLEIELANLSGDLLIETLPKFLANKIKPQEQDHALATFTKKFITQDAFIEPADLETAINSGGNIAEKIYNKIRALNPEPGTWTIQQAQGKPQRMKILEAELTSENKLKLKTIQFESKRPQNI